MFNNIIRSFLLVFFIAIVGRSYATNGCDVTEKDNVEVKADSSSVNNDSVLKDTEEKTEPVVESKNVSQDNIFKDDEEVDEDTTSNSALSFNFIYYIIEKFKFQVE